MGKKKIAWGVLLAALLFATVILLADVLRGNPFELGFTQVALLAASVLAVFGAGCYLAPVAFRFGLRWFFYASITPAAIGIVLLVINVIGLGLSMRNPQANEGFSYAGKHRIAQGGDAEVIADTQRTAGESNKDYAYRLTTLVYDSVIHYWEEDGNEDLRVPIWENWLLWQNGQNPYEFCNPAKAIERRVAVCSQFSKILVAILEEDGGYESVYSYALDGHVVAQVLVDIDTAGNETWWVLDSDYGVVIEHSVRYLEQNPSTVSEAYLDAGYDQDISDLLTGIYGPEGNYEEGNAGICREEAKAYTDKWVVPIWMTIPGVALLLADRTIERFSPSKTRKN